MLLTNSNIKKTVIIVCIFISFHIFTISHIFTHFFYRHNVRKKARGDCTFFYIAKIFIFKLITITFYCILLVKQKFPSFATYKSNKFYNSFLFSFYLLCKLLVSLVNRILQQTLEFFTLKFFT